MKSLQELSRYLLSRISPGSIQGQWVSFEEVVRTVKSAEGWVAFLSQVELGAGVYLIGGGTARLAFLRFSCDELAERYSQPQKIVSPVAEPIACSLEVDERAEAGRDQRTPHIERAANALDACTRHIDPACEGSKESAMMNVPFSVDELLLFHEVLRSGSFTKTGERKEMTKATVSRRLAHLEQQCGALLLKRTTRSVAPTEIGSALFEHCSRILEEISSIDEILMTSRDAVAATLSVSVPSEFGLDWVGKAVSQFVLQFPQVHLHIEVASGPVNPVDHPYDLAINVGELNDPRLVSRPVATLSRGIYASPDYVSRQGPPRTPDDLGAHPFIVTEKRERGAL